MHCPTCYVARLTDGVLINLIHNRRFFIPFYPSGALRHAKFKNFRTDKEKEDCTFEQIPESYSIKASPSGKSTEAFERDHRMASSRMDDIDLRVGPLHHA